MDLKLKIMQNEYWWGGAVEHGSKMPLSADSDYYIDARVNPTANQFNGVFLSSEGRYIVFAGGAEVRVKDGEISVKNAEGGAWGYGSAVKDKEEYLARLRGLFAAAKKMPLVGYCYTQLTDVQQEVNGLLKEDRTPKVPLEEIRKINEID